MKWDYSRGLLRDCENIADGLFAALVLLLLGDGGVESEVPRVRAEGAGPLPEPVTLGPELSAVAGLGETGGNCQLSITICP